MARLFFLFTAISGFISVALGAFGAHALKGRMEESYLKIFHTGVEYQFFHALALGLVASLLLRNGNSLLRASGYLFVVGTVLFSGSLYLWAFTRVGKWGMVTPLGGVCFLLGWALMGWAVYQSESLS